MIELFKDGERICGVRINRTTERQTLKKIPTFGNAKKVKPMGSKPDELVFTVSPIPEQLFIPCNGEGFELHMDGEECINIRLTNRRQMRGRNEMRITAEVVG